MSISQTVWAIGQVGGIFLVLEGGFENRQGFEVPVWIYSTTQTFSSRAAALQWVRAKRRTSLDTIVDETIHKTSGGPLLNGARFGNMHPDHEKLLV